MDQPAWLAAAWAEFGVREIAGAKSEPRIRDYFAEAGHANITDDATPWCAAFLGAMLKRTGLSGTGSLLARSYLDWGAPIESGKTGAIIVLTRGSDPGAGHVGFFLGAARDRVFILGGNQSDGVTVEAFDASRVLGYRWPTATQDESGVIVSPPEAQAPSSDDAFAIALAHVLKMEGGFTDDPHDPGGPTNRGITLQVFARWRGVTIDATSRSRLVEDLKRIPDDTVRDIYRARYWDPSLARIFTPPLAVMHFDAGVNHGVNGAARLLQTSLGVAVDGEIGPQTLRAVAARPIKDLIDRYAQARRARYRALPHFWRFGRGWLNRVTATTDLAHALAQQSNIKGGLVEPGQTAKGESSMDRDASNRNEIVIDEKWWARSKTIWGTIITAAATVLPLIGPIIGIEIPAEVIKQAGEQTLSVVQAVLGLIGTLLALYGRTHASSAITRRVMNVRL